MNFYYRRNEHRHVKKEKNTQKSHVTENECLLPPHKLKRRAQKLCKSRGGRPGLPVPNSPYGLCGRKATLNLHLTETQSSGV